MMINFRTTFLDSTGKVVSSPTLTAMNYFTGWFCVDLLTALPLDVIDLINANNGQVRGTRLYNLVA